MDLEGSGGGWGDAPAGSSWRPGPAWRSEGAEECWDSEWTPKGEPGRYAARLNMGVRKKAVSLGGF